VSDGSERDYFGYSVSLSADGAAALIGAYMDDQKKTDLDLHTYLSIAMEDGRSG
jgi:hypothetical protein